MTAVAVKPLTYYRALCDACGTGYAGPADVDDIAAWEFPSDAILAAKADGWLYHDGALMCTTCLRCQVCGDSPARVGGPELEPHRRILCDECEGPAPRPAAQRRLPGVDRHLTIVASTRTQP